MTESQRALCSDSYVNQKLSLKLDLPRERQVILDLFDRIRRQFSSMTQFRKRKDELALESEPEAALQRWIAIKSNTIRSGVVNPETLSGAYPLHRHVLDISPYYLSLSPLDIDALELLYGFDLVASRNHDEVVYEAMVQGSPLAEAIDLPGAVPVDCQPMFGAVLKEGLNGSTCGPIEVHFEVKTRSAGKIERAAEGTPEPISVYLWVRKYNPVVDVKDLPQMFGELARVGEELVTSRVIPRFVAPIREAIVSGGG